MFPFHRGLASVTPFLWRRAAGLVAIAAALLAALPASAQVTWDADGGTTGPQDGAGTWNTTATNWWDGLTNVAWPNLTTSSAIFGAGSGAAGTVTVSGSVITNAVTFDAPGSGTYTLSGGTISLEGTAPTITANVNASIGSLLAGSAGLVKAGNGVLALSGSNSYTGGTQIDAGAINVTNASALGAGTVTLGASGTALFHGTGSAGYTIANAIAGTGNVSVRSNPGGTIATDGNYTYLTGTLSGFSGTLTVDPFQSAVILGDAALNGSNARWVITNTATTTGYVLSQTAGGTAQLGELSGNGNLGAANAGNGTFWEVGALATSSTFSGAFVNSAGGFSSSLRKVGAGTLTLTGLSLSTGTANVIAGTLQIGDGGTAGSVRSMAITGSSGATLAFNRSDNYGGAYGKPITGGLPLVHLGSGTLTLSGANTYSGGTQINSGGITGSNPSAFGTGTIAIGSAGTATLTAVGTSTNSVTGSGVLALSSGSGNQTTIVNYAGNLSGFTGTVRIQSAGDFVGVTGNYLSGSNARWEVNNSTGSYYLYAGSGTTVAMGELSGNGRIGSNYLNNTTWEVGALSTSSTFSGVFVNAVAPNPGKAILRKVGSGTLTLTGSSAYTGGTQLNGGVLALGNAGALGPSGTISFGGGTLQFSSANTTDYSSRFSTAPGQAYSLDTNGQNVTVGTALSSSGGSLTKLGLGTLTLTGNNSFSGDTTIAGGTLKLGSGGSFDSSPRIIVGDAASNGAVFDITDKTSFSIGSAQTLMGKGTVVLSATTNLTVAGLFSPGNSPGLFTYDGGSTTLSGTTLMEIWGTSRGATYDAVNVINSGLLTLGGMLELNFDRNFADSTSFLLFDTLTSGSLAGGFTGITITGSNNAYVGLSFTQAGNVWTTDFNGNNQGLRLTQADSNVTLDVIVVPEPAAVVLAGLGLAAASFASRRRRIISRSVRYVWAVGAMAERAASVFPATRLDKNRRGRQTDTAVS